MIRCVLGSNQQSYLEYKSTIFTLNPVGALALSKSTVFCLSGFCLGFMWSELETSIMIISPVFLLNSIKPAS